MPKIDIDNAPARSGSSYPEPFRTKVGGKLRRQLGDAAGLTRFGVNLSTLEPGCASALRHWHENEDEFVFVVAGQVVLVEEDGETTLRAGEAAGFKAGVANGHHLVNRSDAPATFLEIGSRSAAERGHYPDDDLAYHKDQGKVRFTRKDGSEAV
jgi:uncharacterized cupin superfamily protein